MTKKLLSVLLLVFMVGSLLLVGCSPAGQKTVNGAAMSDEEREAYILEKMVGDGKILDESMYTKLTDTDENATAGHIVGMVCLAETDDYALYIDMKTTTFAYADKRGETPIFYHSSPNRWLGKKGIGTSDYFSTLILEAYDAANKKYEFNVNDNCISGSQQGEEDFYKVVKMSDTKFRIIYTIGNDSDKELCPLVLRKETYTEIITKVYEYANASAPGSAEETKYEQMLSDLLDLYKGIGPEEEMNEELYNLSYNRNISVKGMDEEKATTKATSNATITPLTIEETELYSTTYPSITLRPLYVLRGSITKRQKQNVREVMELAGFTVSDLKNEMDAVNYNGPARSVLFTIPLDICLENGSMSLEIDSSLVLGPTEQKLYKISVCPFFGADNPVEGTEYMITPDGSGAYVDLKSARYTTTTRQRIYGDDDTFAGDIVTSNYAPVLSGYLVYNRGTNGGFLAVMDQGESHAFVLTNNSTRECPFAGFEVIYIERNFRTYERKGGSSTTSVDEDETTSVSKMEPGEVSASGVITSKYRIDTVFRIRYLFDENVDPDNQKTYADYAKQLRAYLQSQGRFPTEKIKSDSLKFYLDVLGAADIETIVAGFPVTVKGAMTTYEQLGKIIDELDVEGIEGSDIVVKYNYWANGGKESTAANAVRLISELGSKQQLASLIDKLNESGTAFFPSVDFLYVVDDVAGDDFSRTNDSARELDMSIARSGYRYPSDGILYSYRTVVSPANLKRYGDSYMKSFENAVGIKTLALEGFGRHLNSDYRNNNVYTRMKAQDEQVALMKKYKDAGYALMAESGNSYTWNYASYITDLPTGSSESLSSSYSVPFVQMVLHGYIDYCTAPLNDSGDYETALLMLLETGSGVHFEWCYAEDSFFTDTLFYDYYYSRHYGDSLRNAVDVYNEASALLDAVADKEIVGHESLDANILSPFVGDIERYPEFSLTSTSGVFMTTYENGLQIAVNYNNYSVELEDENRTPIGAYSYIYREGADSEWLQK